MYSICPPFRGGQPKLPRMLQVHIIQLNFQLEFAYDFGIMAIGDCETQNTKNVDNSKNF